MSTNKILAATSPTRLLSAWLCLWPALPSCVLSCPVASASHINLQRERRGSGIEINHATQLRYSNLLKEVLFASMVISAYIEVDV